MEKIRILLALAVSACLACGAGAVPAPREEPDLPRHEMILAHHGDASRTDYDIWRMCGDGTQFASLVVLPGQQLQLSVSPDGEEFLYTSKEGDQRDIWRKPFGRGKAVNITSHPADDSQPAWSPDGKKIAFFSNRDAEKLELYLLDAADGSVQRLTDNAFYDSGASWSPDSRKIAFTRYFPPPGDAGGDHSGTGEVILLDLETGKETQITQLGGYNGGLSHSPDGRSIAFHRVADGRAEIWLMDADGANPRALTDTFIDEYDPQWSPDGNWISYTAGTRSDGVGTFDIWLVRPDGSRRQAINKAGNTQGWQRWRPGEHYCR